MITIEFLDGETCLEDLGLIPSMLDGLDPRPAREQLDENYQHGGGWRPQSGYALQPDDSLRYPGDPTFHPLVVIHLHGERVLIYQHALVSIIQPDRSFEVCRMD